MHKSMSTYIDMRSYSNLSVPIFVSTCIDVRSSSHISVHVCLRPASIDMHSSS